MLTKLIKNEFKTTGHYLGIVYLATAIVVAISVIAILLKNDLMAILSCFVLMVLALAFVVVTLLILFISFNKTLYGDQGYLTFTLPVKTRDLLFSKFLVAFVWFLLSYAAMIGLVIWSGSVIANTAQAKLEAGAEEANSLASLIEMAKLFLDVPNKGAFIGYFSFSILLVFVVCLLVIAVLYMSITVGNTRAFQKHNVLWSLIFTGVSGVVCSKVSDLCDVLPFEANLTNEGLKFIFNSHPEEFNLLGLNMILSTNITRTVIFAALIVVMCAITNFIMKKKINIK